MKSLFYFIKISLFFTSCLIILPYAAHASEQAVVTWGEQGSGNNPSYNLFFSVMEEDQWSAPEAISESQKPDILPAIVSTENGNTWVVWTQLEGVNGKLQFRRRINGVWGATQPLLTGLKTNMAPSMILDNQSSPWLVWAGSAGQDDDIYWSRWINSKWSAPVRVNQDNTVPDILPALTLSLDGTPVVSWAGYDGQKYTITYRIWNYTSQSWQKDDKVKTARKTIRDASQNSGPIALPDFITDHSQVSMFVKGKSASINIREER